MSTRLVEPTTHPDRVDAAAADGWITTEEAATRLRISPRTARIWADHGRLTTFRTPGGDTRGGWRSFWAADVDALARLLHAHRATTPGPLRWTHPPLSTWKPTPP